MTIESYNRATEIIKEKEQLEKELSQLRMSIDFKDLDEYVDISNRIFTLGQEFAALK